MAWYRAGEIVYVTCAGFGFIVKPDMIFHDVSPIIPKSAE